MKIYTHFLNFIRSFRAWYIKCGICHNYADVREFALLDNSCIFCLHCAKTEDIINLKVYILTKLANLTSYVWQSDKIMRNKCARSLIDLRKIRRST